MLDTDVKLFEIHFPKQDVKNNTLILNGCNAYLNEKKESIIYSELEEMSYVYLNSNDYENYIQIEFSFCNNQSSSYQKYWARCFSIRTDNGVKIKINGIKYNYNTITKVNKRGDIVLGIVMFLKKDIYEALLEAKVILIEGFIALNRKCNTYGVAVELIKKRNKFKVIFANTFKYKKYDNIYNKWH